MYLDPQSVQNSRSFWCLSVHQHLTLMRSLWFGGDDLQLKDNEVSKQSGGPM